MIDDLQYLRDDITARTIRNESLTKALESLTVALDHHTKTHGLLDEAWYAWEVAERVLEGDNYQRALEKLVDGSPPPKKWRNDNNG